MRILLLVGSGDGEASISVKSGVVFKKLLLSLGHEVIELVFGDDFIDQVRSIAPDLVFNAMHGKFGEDGVVPAILDFLRIPYTHSGMSASIVGMNKDLYKHVCRSLDIPVAPDCVLSASEISKEGLFDIMRQRGWSRAVLKPVSSGSSLGLMLLDVKVPDVDLDVRGYGEYFLLEEYIPGRDFSVCILCNEVLGGPVEIKSSGDIFSYEKKYTAGLSEHDMEPNLPAALRRSMCDYALKAYRVIHCTGMTRTDFRYREDVTDGTHSIVMLEINTHPGFTELSIWPDVARHYGLSLQQLIQTILNEASSQR